ncbi:hypothetical protein PMIN04_010034 [Paraphaeosphaeria minitans]
MPKVVRRPLRRQPGWPSLPHRGRFRQRQTASTLKLSRATAQSGIRSMDNQANLQKSTNGQCLSKACGNETGTELHTGCKTSPHASNNLLGIAHHPSSNGDPIRHSDESRVREYLDFLGATYLLENIPSPERVFDDQDTIDRVVPRRLLVGHHEKMGRAIYAYVLQFGASHMQFGTSHKVKFSVEATPSQASVDISHEDFARQHILYPFDKTLPQGDRSIGQADRTRLALLVKWYFIAAGFTRVRSKSLLTFCKQFHNALRYIEKHPTDRLSRDGFVGGGADGTQLDESDIQAALLAATDPSSPSLTTSPGDAKDQIKDCCGRNVEVGNFTMGRRRSQPHQINTSSACSADG